MMAFRAMRLAAAAVVLLLGVGITRSCTDVLVGISHVGVASPTTPPSR